MLPPRSTSTCPVLAPDTIWLRVRSAEMSEPLPPAEWGLVDPSVAEPGEDLVAIGGGLDPGTLVSAYRTGLFPMHVAVTGHGSGGGEALGWWSPDPRGVLDPASLIVSRSLASSVRHMDTSVDQSFVDVVRSCADPNRPHGWITEEFVDAYVELHRRGYAHSIEVWQDGELVGGLYGVEVGGLFAGESMFHRRRDASKVALVALVEILRACPGERLIDVQWCTHHLASLGAIEITRAEYLAKVAALLNEEPCLGGVTAADRF